MKLSITIVVIIAAIILCTWGIQATFKLYDQVITQRDSAAYWKGRYDSVVKAHTERVDAIDQNGIHYHYSKDPIIVHTIDSTIVSIAPLIDTSDNLIVENYFHNQLVNRETRKNKVAIAGTNLPEVQARSIKTGKLFYTDSIVIRLKNPIRHSRHRKNNSHYKHDEEINDKHFPDYLGTDTVPINQAPARMEMLTKSEPFLAPCITTYEFQIFRDTSYSAIVVKMDKDSTVEIMGDTSRIIRNLIFSYWRYVEQESKKTEELRKAKYLLYRMLMLKYYPAMQIKFCKH